MKKLCVRVYVHAIANGVAVVTPQNSDFNKRYLPMTDIDITPDQSQPRLATIHIPDFMAYGYELAKRPEPPVVAPAATIHLTDSDLDLGSESQTQPSAAGMAARLLKKENA